MKITPEKPISITTTLTALTVESVTDLPGRKVVIAKVSELPGAVVLWKGEEYDKIDQWTDSDVQARIVELLTKPPVEAAPSAENVESPAPVDTTADSAAGTDLTQEKKE